MPSIISPISFLIREGAIRNPIKTVPACLAEISFGREKLKAESIRIAYSDSYLAAYLIKRKSTKGIYVSFYGGLISWGSKRQRATALSTAES